MKNFDFNKLNTITKYPSIPTYHKICGKGHLLENLTEGLNFNSQIELSEKIDGENTREVFIIENGQVDYYIGSREELLYAKGDRIINPKGNMVETIKPIADRLVKELPNTFNNQDGIFVIYHEIYGGNTPHTKEYTINKSIGLRVFDMFFLPLNIAEELIEKPITYLSGWRDNMHQPFFDTVSLRQYTQELGLENSPIRMSLDNGEYLPKTLEEMYLFIYKNFYTTNVSIDNNIKGRNEGIVVRTKNRSSIAKIRFEDYERTLGLRGMNAKLINKEIRKLEEEMTANDIQRLQRVDFLKKLLSLM